MSSRILLTLLLTSSCALAQASYQGDHADWTPPGTYAAPSPLRVSTPSVAPESVPTPLMSLGTVSLKAGASNGTEGNVAGASAFLAGQNLTGTAEFATQNWYGPAVAAVPLEPETEGTESVQPDSGFDFGIAQFEFNRGAKQVMSKPGAHSKRTYTEGDVARMNDANGLVRFRGKTEHVD
jgi:hypothetical protein